MLVAEIDGLHIDLWHARMARGERETVVAVEAEEAETVASSLHTRLQRALRRNRTGESAVQSGLDKQSGPDRTSDTSASPQAWLAELRRQK